MRWTTWSTVTALSLALAREARAQQPPPAASDSVAAVFPTVELDYQVAADLTCPTAEQLRADLAKEMKYDAFDGSGTPSGRFHVVIARGRPGLIRVRVSF